MRADRLLSLLMLLQTHGRMTAQELAIELEVSERTVYRDVDALSIAGVPIYADRGPGGGFALVDRYRTDLTGLTADEVRALFMLSIPAPLDDLGVGRELKTALRKLAAALPTSRLEEEAHVRQRVYLDWSGWNQVEEPAPYLAEVQRAVLGDHPLRMVYRLPFDSQTERIVQPLGLVAKASRWHLIYASEGLVRVLPVARLLIAETLDGRCERPPDFDLQQFWHRWRQQHEAHQTSYAVRVRLAPQALPTIAGLLGGQTERLLETAEPPDTDGWVAVLLHFESLEAARTRLLGLGRAVEVLSPLALRLSLADFARQVADFYTARGASGDGAP